MAIRTTYDPWLFLTGPLLMLVGLVMVGSSSLYVAMRDWNDPAMFLWKQALHALVGLVAFIIALNLPYRKLANRRLIFVLFVVCVVLLIRVLTMPAIAGARRWDSIGQITYQPSEIAKLFVVLYMASMLARKQERINEPWSVSIPCLTVVGMLAFLVLLEPDLGSTVMLVGVPAIMLVVAGLRWKYVATAAAIGCIGLAAGLITNPYQLARIKDFVYYILGLRGPNFQLEQSLIAFGSGGLTGVGLGQGQQKAFFLPACHTDFIFSSTGEELGLIGTNAILIAFVLILWRGIRTARRTREPFGSYLALGITLLLVLQSLIHMGVCLGLLPTTGLPLPFISYGGSSLVVSMAAMGLLVNISQESNLAGRQVRGRTSTTLSGSNRVVRVVEQAYLLCRRKG